MKLSDLLVFSDIIIQCHDFPDADSIAAGYGIYCYLTSRGKNPRLIYSGTKRVSKPNLIIMTEKLNIPLEYADKLNRKPELLITVDCVHGENNVTSFEAENYAAIDHHLSIRNTSPLYDIRPAYGSCSSVVAVLLKEADFSINDNSNLATALYYGLYTDTGGMSEVSYPADRDLRDFSCYNKEIISVLVNSNLSLPELRIAGEAFNNVRYLEKHRFASVCTEECDPNILGFINDLVLQVDSVYTSVVCCRISGGVKLSVRSCINEVNAAELISYITENIGAGGGQSRKAGGFISSRLVSETGTDFDADDPLPYIEKKISEYRECFDVIYGESYVPDLPQMKSYIKKSQTFGYVKSTDIFPSGTHFSIRTLEADFDIDADEDIYIMIGKSGNVYPISGEKFMSTYIPSDAHFEISSEYNPCIISKVRGHQELLPYAESCAAKSGSMIYASELTRRTKLYRFRNTDNYMTGRPGDFLAVRGDDHKDVYIVSREQFKDTYELN